MQGFELLTARRTDEAVRLMSSHPNAIFIAGGTTVVDLLKCGVTHPPVLIDINGLPLAEIESDDARIPLRRAGAQQRRGL